MYIDLQKAFESETFLNKKINTLIPIGVDFEWKYIFEDLKDLNSIIMTGSTGSGKSNFANCVILSLLKQKEPITLILCDCKIVEFTPYKKILDNVYTKVDDMKRQLESLSLELKVRSLKKSEDENSVKYFSKIFLIIDEYADIAHNYPDFFQKTIKNLAKNGPDLNIFLMIHTSRPDPKMEMPEDLRDSFFTKIAFATASSESSQTIIGETGAEKLLGHGDMLFKKGDEYVKRLQGFYISEEEKEKFINGYEKL